MTAPPMARALPRAAGDRARVAMRDSAAWLACCALEVARTVAVALPIAAVAILVCGLALTIAGPLASRALSVAPPLLQPLSSPCERPPRGPPDPEACWQARFAPERVPVDDRAVTASR